MITVLDSRKNYRGQGMYAHTTIMNFWALHGPNQLIQSHNLNILAGVSVKHSFWVCTFRKMIDRKGNREGGNKTDAKDETLRGFLRESACLNENEWINESMIHQQNVLPFFSKMWGKVKHERMREWHVFFGVFLAHAIKNMIFKNGALPISNFCQNTSHSHQTDQG